MKLFVIISILSPLFPLIAGFRRRFTLLWLYVLTGFSFDLLITLIRRVLHWPHYLAANLFVLAEFLLVSFIYKDKIFKKPALFYSFTGLLSLFFIATTYEKAVADFNTFGSSFFSFSYIIYGIAGLYTLLQEQKVVFLEKSSFFWVNVAFIIYASGNFLLFLFRYYLQENDLELYKLLWSTFFLSLNVVKNILLGIALSKKTHY